jgi:hypothetical protein
MIGDRVARGAVTGGEMHVAIGTLHLEEGNEVSCPKIIRRPRGALPSYENRGRVSGELVEP